MPIRRLPPTPALDGLRGLAIAAVALFHFPTKAWVPGGLFGVGVFFVLSGFLITPILMHEQDRTGRVGYREFLRRRAWRLLPALLVFLAAFLVADALAGGTGWFASNPFAPTGPGNPVPLGLAVRGVAAALTYTYNEALVWAPRMPLPLGHLWTLAVEGQFYVGWALVAPRLLRRGPRLLVGVTAALIAASAVSQWVGWPHHDWIYFATLPRVQQLLAGALLGEAWALGALDHVPSWLWRAGAVAGAGGLCYLAFAVADEPLKYRGAFTVVAAATPLVVAHLADGRTTSAAQRFLSSRPVVWLGKRSYALYLWHWPFALWTNQFPDWWGVPLGFGCSLAAAELSWRLVEGPAGRWARRQARPRSRPGGDRLGDGAPREGPQPAQSRPRVIVSMDR